VAHSEGLSEAFIKNDILPYCVYSGGNKEKCLTAVNYPCGRMLLGQAVHDGRVFFQHNYIIPPQGVKDICLKVKFETAYNASRGESLPALEDLPEEELIIDKEITTELTEEAFSYIIACLAQSTAGGKKTYILTPCDDVHGFACNLLALLLPRLPAPLRHVLGFCTNTRGPLNKRGIHLIFTNDPRIPTSEGHFLIDFAGKLGIIETQAVNDGDFFAARFAAMSEQRFCERIFDEIDFWLARMPEMVYETAFTQSIKERMARIIKANDVLPEVFIRRGKSGKYAEIIGCTPADFVIPDILRRVKYRQNETEPTDLRYFLGSYRLDPLVHDKLLKTLQGEDFSHVLYPQCP
jgi:hypothetical protein